VRRIRFWWLLDAHFLRQRASQLDKAIERLLGIEHVYNNEAILCLCSGVHQYALDGYVGKRFQPVLAIGQTANDSLILLLRKARRFMDRHDHVGTSLSAPDDSRSISGYLRTNF
jgi:hypothetical protein